MVSSANAVFMVRPAAFQFNVETALSNDFQKKIEGLSGEQVLAKARLEFDIMVNELREQDIDVVVFDDAIHPVKPDAIFPNNWISLSQEGVLTIFPMKTENRRLEKREDIINFFRNGYQISKEIDLSRYEGEERALEGTGSIVFDHVNRIAYACLSPRTDREILEDYCHEIDYTPMVFHSFDASDKLIYHTNVVMCVGSGYVVIGMDSIKDKDERIGLENKFKESNLEIISLDNHQLLESFAGNMLEVQNKNGKRFLVMSRRAYKSLKEYQIKQLTNYIDILPVSIDLIETVGGGSARCMMAEIYLKKK